MAQSTLNAYLGNSDTSSDSSPTHTPTSCQSSLCDHEVGLEIYQPTPTCQMHTADPAQYILVIGGLGYVGSHTTCELLRDGHNVVIIDNLSNSHIEVVHTLEQMCDELYAGTGTYRPKIDFHAADARDEAKIQRILKRYVVPNTSPLQSSIFGAVHFAAYKSVPESLRHPLRYYDNNVSGLISICNTLSLFNIKRLVFSSSAAVYGSLANEVGRLEEERCVHETTRWRDANGEERVTQSGCKGLTNPYGRSKWMCEAILSDLASSDPDWAIVMLRYFNPVGCDESGLLGENPRALPTNLIPVLLEVVRGDSPHLRVFGDDWDTPDGTAIRDFIHVSDLARGHLNALETTRLQGLRTYNLGTGRGHSVLEVAQAMEEVSGRKVPLVQAGRREGDVGMCVAEPTKAENELGWKSQRTLMNSCKDLCRFLSIPVMESVATEHEDGRDCKVEAP